MPCALMGTSVRSVTWETVEIVEAYVAPPPPPAPELPTTASPLPLIGLAGGLFIALGGLMAGLRRRR